MACWTSADVELADRQERVSVSATDVVCVDVELGAELEIGGVELEVELDAMTVELVGVDELE